MTGSPARSPAPEGDRQISNLFLGRWRWLAAALLACLGVSVASGVFLAFHDTRDLSRYFTLRNHIGIGLAGTALLIALTFRHLKEIISPAFASATLGFMLVFQMVAFAELGPYARFFLPLLIWVGFIGTTMVRSRKARSPEAIVGFVALTVWVLLTSTGFFLAGPVRAIRTSLYSHVHAWVGTFGALAIVLHIVRKSSIFVRGAWRLPALCLVAALSVHLLRVEWNTSEIEGKARLRYVSAEASSSVDAGPEGCGFKGCHTEITKQWQWSAHRFSGSNRPYLKVADLFEQEQGKGAREYCERCHEPSRFMPASYSNTHASPADLGVSCRACHLVDSVPPGASNGEFHWAAEPVFLPGKSTESEPMASLLKSYVRDDLLFHREAYQRDVLRSDEYCASCHRVKIPADFNGDREIVVDGVHKSWSRSRQAAQGINCVHCHMQLFEFEDPDSFEVRGHSRPDHRLLGIHTSLDEILPPQAAGPDAGAAFLRDTRSWLDGTLAVSNYEQFFLWYTRDARSVAFKNYFKGRPLLDLAIDASQLGTRSGLLDGGRSAAEKIPPQPPFEKGGSGGIYGAASELDLLVRTTNRRISHEFPGGLLLLVDAWLEVNVRDASGQEVYSSGKLLPDGTHESTQHRLGLDGFDRYGQPIRFNRFWALSRVENKRVIGPDETVDDRFEVSIPPNATPPLTVSARWWYRRYKNDFAAWALDSPTPLRALPIASAELTVSQPASR